MEFGFERMGAIDFKKLYWPRSHLACASQGEFAQDPASGGVETPMPPVGTPIMNGDSNVGEIVAGLDGHALVLVRSDALPLRCADGCSFKLRPGLF